MFLKTRLLIVAIVAVVASALPAAASHDPNATYSIVVSPSTNLSDSGGVQVSVTGTGFAANTTVRFYQWLFTPGTGYQRDLATSTVSDSAGGLTATVTVNYLIDTPNPYSPYQCDWTDTQQCRLEAEAVIGTVIQDAYSDITFAGHDTRTGPTATSSSEVTDEDVPLSFSPAAHASDRNGLPLTYSVSTQPSYGGVAVSSDGLTFVYTPNVNFNGRDSFTWRATNSDGQSSSAATVTLTVVSVDDPPSCTDGFTISTAEDAATTITFPCSDVDSPVAVTAVVDRAVGSFSSGTSVAKTFTPAANYNGTFSFSYSTTAAAYTGTGTVSSVADVHTMDVSATPSSPRKLDVLVVVRHPDMPPKEQFTITVMWGDKQSSVSGTSATPIQGPTYTASDRSYAYVMPAMHTYARKGRYLVTVTSKDLRTGLVRTWKQRLVIPA